VSSSIQPCQIALARPGIVCNAIVVARNLVRELAFGADVRVRGGGTFQTGWAFTIQDALTCKSTNTGFAIGAGAIGLGGSEVVAGGSVVVLGASCACSNGWVGADACSVRLGDALVRAGDGVGVLAVGADPSLRTITVALSSGIDGAGRVAGVGVSELAVGANPSLRTITGASTSGIDGAGRVAGVGVGELAVGADPSHRTITGTSTCGIDGAGRVAVFCVGVFGTGGAVSNC
jgi:hypothetical protein